MVHRRGGRDVAGGDLGDALAMDVGAADPGVERERGEDRRLGRGVEALDVGGRVGLGVAERLGLLDGLGEARSRRVHLVEHEVRRAVDDPEDLADVVTGERLADRPEDRDRAGDGRLVVEVDVGGVGRGIQGGAVLGEQRLVGGHDRGAVLHRPEDEAAGGLDAADDLDDDVGAGDQLGRVGREERGVDRDVGAVLAEPADGDADELEWRADPRPEVVGMGGEHPRHRRSDDAAAQQGHAQGGTGFVRHVGSRSFSSGPTRGPGRRRRGPAGPRWSHAGRGLGSRRRGRR